MSEAQMKAPTESFANLAAAFIEAELEDRRCEEKLQRAQDDAQRAADRVNTIRKQLADLRWLNGKTIRTSALGSQVLTLTLVNDVPKIFVTEGELRDGGRR